MPRLDRRPGSRRYVLSTAVQIPGFRAPRPCLTGAGRSSDIRDSFTDEAWGAAFDRRSGPNARFGKVIGLHPNPGLRYESPLRRSSTMDPVTDTRVQSGLL